MTNEFEEKKDELIQQKVDESEYIEPVSDEVEMKPTDFGFFTYIKTPKVGESITLEVKKIVKKPARELENKANGKKFWTGLEDKNGKRTETIIETVNNERYTIDSWGLYFGLFGKEAKFQQLANDKGSYEGIKIKISHNYNGKDATSSPEDIMKLRDFKTIEEAKKHIETVGKAMKDGSIYTVEIL